MKMIKNLNGSYSPRDDGRTMATPPHIPQMGMSKIIREANWRQGRSNIQSASDILKKRCH